MEIVIGSVKSRVTIPDEARFEDLQLVVYEDGHYDVNPDLLRRIGALNADLKIDDPATIFNLIEGWYRHLRLRGYRHELGEKWFVPEEGRTERVKLFTGSAVDWAIVSIPDDIAFDDLNLTVNPDDGLLEFDWGPLRRIAERNVELTFNDETTILNLLDAWYGYLRLTGYRHEVAEQWFGSSDAAKTFGISRLFAGPDTFH